MINQAFIDLLTAISLRDQFLHNLCLINTELNWRDVRYCLHWYSIHTRVPYFIVKALEHRLKADHELFAAYLKLERNRNTNCYSK